MIRKRILFIFGTRPEAIKVAPVIRHFRVSELLKREFTVKICLTAQHRHMLDQVLKMFSIKPDIDLDIMKRDQSLEDIVSGVMKGMVKVFDKIKPDVVLVQGDTTTAFIVALSAFFRKVKV